MTARFTLFFKDKPLQSYLFDAGVIHIGRDDTNNIKIDSLAVAPIHAVVIIRTTECIIRQINDDFPLLVNNHAHLEYCLADHDHINIGKHSLIYVSIASSTPVDETESWLLEPIKTEFEPQDANLQVIEGRHIGHVIPVKKAITRLGRHGEGVIIISKRKEGYFISALESNSKLTVNQELLADKIIKLAHQDIISIDNVLMQFFLN